MSLLCYCSFHFVYMMLCTMTFELRFYQNCLQRQVTKKMKTLRGGRPSICISFVYTWCHVTLFLPLLSISSGRPSMCVCTWTHAHVVVKVCLRGGPYEEQVKPPLTLFICLYTDCLFHTPKKCLWQI